MKRGPSSSRLIRFGRLITSSSDCITKVVLRLNVHSTASPDRPEATDRPTRKRLMRVLSWALPTTGFNWPDDMRSRIVGAERSLGVSDQGSIQSADTRPFTPPQGGASILSLE